MARTADRFVVAMKAETTQLRKIKGAGLSQYLYEKQWMTESSSEVGSPGPNGETIHDIEEAGVDEFLAGLQRELNNGAYHPGALLRKEVEKRSGGVSRRQAAWDPDVRDAWSRELSRSSSNRSLRRISSAPIGLLPNRLFM